MKKILYISDTELAKLAREVQIYLDRGWDLHGTVVVDPPGQGESALYIQAITEERP